MADRLSFDTSFLIDFQRERAQGGRAGRAHDFLTRNEAAHLCVSAVALGEFAEGFEDTGHPLVELLRATHEVFPIDEDVGLIYGGLTRRLRAVGRLIGTNDLWIAATALRHDVPLVTADVDHFRRVPALQVCPYR